MEGVEGEDTYEPGPAHPGNHRRAHHRRAAHGVLRVHGRRRPRRRPRHPELWPLGTEALALAMEVSVLEAKRLGHRAVLRLSWLLLVASVALSTLLQVAVAPPTLVGYLTAGATPVWLLGSFAVLSLLYRADISADPATAAAEASAEQTPTSAAVAPSSAHPPPSGAEVLTKRVQAERAYADLSADGAPVSSAQLAAVAGLSSSYARALLAEFQARPPADIQGNGRPSPHRRRSRWVRRHRDWHDTGTRSQPLGRRAGTRLGCHLKDPKVVVSSTGAATTPCQVTSSARRCPERAVNCAEWMLPAYGPHHQRPAPHAIEMTVPTRSAVLTGLRAASCVGAYASPTRSAVAVSPCPRCRSLGR
jgi:hypothetical protein